MKSEQRMIMSCPNVVRPSSMELSRFFSRSMGSWQTLSGYISQTNVIILKYCKHRDGNLRRSTVMRGMMVFSPYRHTSAAVTVCSPSDEPSATTMRNTKQNMATLTMA
jgi:DNA-binding transcriptional regulator of glucitol operon